MAADVKDKKSVTRLTLGTVTMEPISQGNLREYSKIVRETIEKAAKDSEKAQRNVDIARKCVAR